MLDALAPVSDHLLEHRDALVAAATLGPVADLACGRGRHAMAVAGWGLPVLGIDRNGRFLEELQHRAAASALPIQPVRADLEVAACLPLRPGSCGAVLVFRFLFRSLAPRIEALLAPGGLLLYETFSEAQAEREGGPSNPAFLLADGELPRLFPGLRVLSYREQPAQGVASLAARKPV
ncbi:MAG: class I SAM-dependent methyltransferase [Myxococcota bacterium]|nr:class I SAM-dependent methyltransferase [Myxococcota bacterium]